MTVGRMSQAAVLVDLLLLTAGLTLLAIGRHELTGDAGTRLQQVTALVRRGELTAGKYSLIGPLAAAPVVLLVDDPAILPAAAGRVNLALFSLLLLCMGCFMASEANSGVARRTLLLLVFGSLFGHHVQDFTGETFTAVTVALGLMLAARLPNSGTWLSTSRLVGAIVLMSLGTANTPALLPAVTLGVIMMAWRGDRRLLAAPALALLLIFAENTLRRGGPFLSGYEGDRGFPTVMPFSGRPGFSYPWVLGLYSILLAPGKGLCWFTPGIWLERSKGHLAGAVSRWHLGLMAIVAGMVATYAGWWSWYGGWWWGPRFFLLASLPASVLLAVRLSTTGQSWRDRAVVGAALTLSLWVGANGAVFSQRPAEAYLATRGGGFVDREFLFWYVPEFSPLVMPFWQPVSLTSLDWGTLALHLIVWLRLVSGLVVRAGRSAFPGNEVRGRVPGKGASTEPKSASPIAE